MLLRAYEENFHMGGHEHNSMSKKMMIEAEWSSTNFALSYGKFKSDNRSSCEREYHYGES